MCDTGNSWYAFYTYSNREKVACEELLKRHYEVFLPMVTTFRQWQNRQKKNISKVLFPSYIFVKTNEAEIFNIVKIPHIVNCVKCGDRPAVVPDTVISCIKIMLEMGQEVFTSHDFTEGEHVKVVRGPLKGYEGVLVEQKGENLFCIRLIDIKRSACINIPTSMLKKIR